MDRLADVELQLIMHGLVGSELLQFARCSRTLLHAADSAFAWRFTTAPLHFELNGRNELLSRPLQLMRSGWNSLFHSRPPPASVVALPHPLRHRASLRLLPPSKHSIPRSNLSALLAQLTCSPSSSLRLHELHLSYGAPECVSGSAWNRLLSHPSCRSLCILDMSAFTRDIRWPEGMARLDAETIRLISSMPQLHTLRLGFMPGVSLAPLSALSHLTSLRIEGGSAHSLLVDTLPASLTDLQVLQPAAWVFRSIFGSAIMQHNLQSLTLTGWKAEILRSLDPPFDLAAAFASMRSLHSLQLIWVRNIDVVLPHLVHAPKIAALTIEPCQGSSHFQNPKKNDSVPSPAVLTDLFANAPNLHCVIRFAAIVRMDPFLRLRHISDRLTMIQD